MYMTLGWRVRSTRRAFEKELRRTGMSKKDAKRLSAAFEELKDNVVGMLKSGAFSAFSIRL
jgi:mRNA-degrading endonuclease RelE of RelBE toxin-antitoxin system